MTTRRELKRFVDVPWPIYAHDPHWVPPLRIDVAEFLNPRKHPFYCHGAAAKLLALRGGRPLGRILVSDDPSYNRQHGTNTGCFGMFECDDDPQAAHALLDAAAAWLRRRGRSAMMGPVDYSTKRGIRFTQVILAGGCRRPAATSSQETGSTCTACWTRR